MKIKNLFITLSITLFALAVQAQDPVSNFIMKYGRKSASEKVIIRLSRLPLSLAMPFADKEGRRWIKKASLVEIMVLEGTRAELSGGFEKLGRDLKRRNFEPLITIKSEGNDVNILGRTDRYDNIRDIVLLVNDSNKDAVLIRVKGKFNLSDIEKIQDGIANNHFIGKN